ncbi:RodZ domain-containing protein [Ningiella sp. W23]|uniref:RodZ domain-containing protein n=1 Tax=Ningiella sp. W23 TaxID=3023715 RepID=UPI0037571B5D
MSDNETLDQQEQPKETKSLGAILASAREQQGLSQQQVADSLHLRLSSVHAIESDSIEADVSLTFTKGYIRLYARLLGLKVEPLLRMFDKLHAQDTKDAKLQSFSKRVAREANDSRWNMVTYIIAILVIGSVVVWWVDQSRFSFSDTFNDDASSESSVSESSGEISISNDNISDNRSNIESLPVDTLPQDAEQKLESQGTDSSLDNSADPFQIEDASSEDSLIVDADDTIQTGDTSASDDGVIDDTLNAEVEIRDQLTSAQIALSEGTDSTPDDIDNEIRESNADTLDNVQSELDMTTGDGSALQNADLPYTVNADGTVDMVFTFSNDCWVSVKDAFDETIAVGVKVKGRVMEVSGVPPIAVILGNPQYVEIDFGGQKVDMSGYDGSRSANFQLPIQGE